MGSVCQLGLGLSRQHAGARSHEPVQSSVWALLSQPTAALHKLGKPHSQQPKNTISNSSTVEGSHSWVEHYSHTWGTYTRSRLVHNQGSLRTPPIESGTWRCKQGAACCSGHNATQSVTNSTGHGRPPAVHVSHVGAQTCNRCMRTETNPNNPHMYTLCCNLSCPPAQPSRLTPCLHPQPRLPAPPPAAAASSAGRVPAAA